MNFQKDAQLSGGGAQEGARIVPDDNTITTSSNDGGQLELDAIVDNDPTDEIIINEFKLKDVARMFIVGQISVSHGTRFAALPVLRELVDMLQAYVGGGIYVFQNQRGEKLILSFGEQKDSISPFFLIPWTLECFWTKPLTIGASSPCIPKSHCLAIPPIGNEKRILSENLRGT